MHFSSDITIIATVLTCFHFRKITEHFTVYTFLSRKTLTGNLLLHVSVEDIEPNQNISILRS